MKRAIFHRVLVLVLLAIFLTVGAAVMITHPGPEDGEFFTREIPEALDRVSVEPGLGTRSGALGALLLARRALAAS